MNYMNIELLAPAGSYQTVKAAIHAGADAVYMGGMKFGARAFAENGDEDTVISAIRYVHLYGKKLYLTVNTLLKNKELEEELYSYLKPLYEAGLDAVIVQDPGVLSFIKESFPELPIHASTQMTITGAGSAALLEKSGCTRIVTARELSLEEIKEIRNKTSLEIESFIHGALCYCYSGQCLMSSLLGGRSGNRGRCAQPCRLPYGVFENKKQLNSEKNQFALSPKDMCTIEILPDVIRSGVTSLKIEGRMKKPEYTAGVVRIYRKYLDLYLNNQAYYDNNPGKYYVEPSDLQELHDLYNRDGFHTGYYKTHNGPKMMAVKNEKLTNGQKVRNEALFRRIKTDFVDQQRKIPIDGFLELREDMPAKFVISSVSDMPTCNIEYNGAVVASAQKQPLTKERVMEQMKKTGNTPFVFRNITIEMDEHIFLPMQALNELRRNGLEAYETGIHEHYIRCAAKTKDSVKMMQFTSKESTYMEAMQGCSDVPYAMNASVETVEQLQIAMTSDYVTGIYASITLFPKQDVVRSILHYIEESKKYDKELYLALPFIVRNHTKIVPDHCYQELLEHGLKGYLVRSLESLSYFIDLGLQEHVILDANLYTYNNRAKLFYQNLGIKKDIAPYELNLHELAKRNNKDSQIVIYGYQPLMVSAQCVTKNFKKCTKKTEILKLKDRYKKEFSVKNVCDFCYNIIYNSIPLGIWKEEKELKRIGFKTFCMNFTMEQPQEMKKLLHDFGERYLFGKNTEFQSEHFTKGHLKRGVE